MEIKELEITFDFQNPFRIWKAESWQEVEKIWLKLIEEPLWGSKFACHSNFLSSWVFLFHNIIQFLTAESELHEEQPWWNTYSRRVYRISCKFFPWAPYAFSIFVALLVNYKEKQGLCNAFVEFRTFQSLTLLQDQEPYKCSFYFIQNT